MRNRQQQEATTILTYDKRGALTPTDLRTIVEQSLDSDKALDIVSIELDDQSALADHMVIATGTSSRHVASLAQKLKQRLEARGVKNVRLEGLSQADWVAVDAGDIIVHLFRQEVRDFYNLEKMWRYATPTHIVAGGQATA